MTAAEQELGAAAKKAPPDPPPTAWAGAKNAPAHALIIDSAAHLLAAHVHAVAAHVLVIVLKIRASCGSVFGTEIAPIALKLGVLLICKFLKEILHIQVFCYALIEHVGAKRTIIIVSAKEAYNLATLLSSGIVHNALHASQSLLFALPRLVVCVVGYLTSDGRILTAYKNVPSEL